MESATPSIMTEQGIQRFDKMEDYTIYLKDGETVRISHNRQKVLKEYHEFRVVFEDSCFYGLQDVNGVMYRSPTSAIRAVLKKEVGLHVIFVRRSGGGPFERGIWTPLKDARTLKWCPPPTLKC